MPTLSGTISPASSVVVGSPGHGSNNEGKVEIWEKTGGTSVCPYSWAHQATVVGNANENIGSAVAIEWFGPLHSRGCTLS